jgi:hypothetical protein
MRGLSHFPKTDIRFWQNAVFRQPYTVDGQRRLTKEWYARLQYGGKRQFFSLGTPNKAAAAATSFRWEENVIRIEATRYFHPKSEDSIADLPVDREVMALFRAYYERAKGRFVIKSSRPPLPSKPQQYYRVAPCDTPTCVLRLNTTAIRLHE